MKKILSVTLMLVLFVSFARVGEAANKPVFKESVSASDMREKYDEALASGKKVRILIVPGHEPGFGGAQYSGYYERELVVSLADKLASELRKDPRLEVLVARGNEGWNTDLSRYFDKSMKTIQKFVDTHKKEMKKLVRRGKVEKNEEQASHNAAPNDVALRLYGITKWSNERDVDLMIHIHLNDTGGHTDSTPGAYTGLAIYVPDSQFGNAKASKAIATPVFKHLNTFVAKSTLPIEDKGIVEDQELIALGANNTSEVPSILIEYGYIYERMFTDDAIRGRVFDELAYQTSTGVRDFFGVKPDSTHVTYVIPPVPVPVVTLPVVPLPATTIPPVAVTTPVPVTSAPVCKAFESTLVLDTTDAKTNGEVTRLQKLLAKDTTIYPEGKVSGYYGPATDKAVKALQVKKGLAKVGDSAYGTVGPKTKAAFCAL